MSFAPVNGYIWNATTGGVPSNCLSILDCEEYARTQGVYAGYNFGEGQGGCVAPLGSCYTLLRTDLGQIGDTGFTSFLLTPPVLASKQDSKYSWFLPFLIVTILLLFFNRWFDLRKIFRELR